MNIIVCVKRVPDIGARIDLSDDQRTLVTKNLGFTISPHEECAVEEALRLVEAQGGQTTVLTLGPAEAEEQLRDGLARGVDRGILLETDGAEWDPSQTAAAIAATIRADADKAPYDLILFGAESADSGGCQVGIRVAHALGLPCVASIKKLELSGGGATAWREVEDGWEIYDLPLPAVVTIKEGINLPRYPSLRGTMKAKKKPVERKAPDQAEATLVMHRLAHPPEQAKQVQMLGDGPAAAPKVVEVLETMEVI